MPSLCIATSYDPPFRDIGDYAAMTMRLYGRRHGYSVYVDNDAKCDRHPSWHRIKSIPKLFDRGYEYVLWMDADALFMRFDRDIAEVITGQHDLYLAQHDDASQPSKVPNMGVMLLRNSAWSLSLLDRLWAMEQYADHVWWDNAAMIKLLGYHSLLGDGPDEPAADMLPHVQFIDYNIWNFIPSICPADADPVIRHYAGFSAEARRLEIPRLALASCFRALEETLPHGASSTLEKGRASSMPGPSLAPPEASHSPH